MLTLTRFAPRPTYTIGRLYLDGVYLCDTLEDRDRGFTENTNASEIQKKKICSETAIPTGVYRLDFVTISPRFGAQPFYKEVCGGMLPRLVAVPGFEGVLIHTGNTPEHTSGCILVGRNIEKGKVMQSRETFARIYPELLAAHRAAAPGCLKLFVNRAYSLIELRRRLGE